MLRLVSGVFALGLLVSTYFLCPETLMERIYATVSPSSEVLTEMREGIETLTGRFTGPGELNPAERAAAE